jgi:hypothetical protein
MNIPAGLLGLILLFIDGIIFGIAVRKGVTAVLLIIVGFVLAGFIGLAIPFLAVNDFWTHLVNIVNGVGSNIGEIIYGFPIAWIVGLIVGLLI